MIDLFLGGEENHIDVVVSTLQENLAGEIDDLLALCGAKCADERLEDVGAFVIAEENTKLHDNVTVVICWRGRWGRRR